MKAKNNYRSVNNGITLGWFDTCEEAKANADNYNKANGVETATYKREIFY